MSLIKENKKFQPNWHCCMCCNPANGRVDYEDGWLKKSSWIIKVQQKKKKIYKLKNCFFISFSCSLLYLQSSHQTHFRVCNHRHRFIIIGFINIVNKLNQDVHFQHLFLLYLISQGKKPLCSRLSIFHWQLNSSSSSYLIYFKITFVLSILFVYLLTSNQ